MATAPRAAALRREIREDLFRPLSRRQPRLRAGDLRARSSWARAGLVAWGYQLRRGMGVTGLQRPVFWGFYIVDFVFWIGISHAGTLISAILRLTDAGWRKPVTRAAEAITVFALMIGGMFPIIHLGRAWLFYWLFPYPNSRLLWPNFRSPLLWDLTAIVTYLTGSVIYLYLPLIPDMAQLAEHNTPWRRALYRMLSLGWTGSDREWHALERAMKLMAGIILAVAVSVHTVVAWDFAMAHRAHVAQHHLRPVLRGGRDLQRHRGADAGDGRRCARCCTWRSYLTRHHFNNLAKLLLLMSLLWFYFTMAENLTVWYGNEPKEMAVFGARTRAPLCAVLLDHGVAEFRGAVRAARHPAAAHHSRPPPSPSVCVLIGMWLERYHHRGADAGQSAARLRHPALYAPTWVEIAITAATFAAMVMLYMIFSKLFPIIAVWEFKPHPQEED